jgi:hypothetical protein
MSFFFLPLLAHGFCKRKKPGSNQQKIEIEAQQQHCCKQPKG